VIFQFQPCVLVRQHSSGATREVSRVTMLGFKSWLCYLVALNLKKISNFNSLRLGFFVSVFLSIKRWKEGMRVSVMVPTGNRCTILNR
jgi:hypothetical protein